MRYMITGSEGFIGRNLRKHISNSMEDKIISIDIEGKTIHTRNDIFYRIPVESIIYKDDFYDKIDIIYHLAAMSSPVQVEERPFAGIKSNILGTSAILEFARINHINNVVIASSSATLGNSLYGLTKSMGEEIGMYYHRHYQLNVVLCRFYNVFGNYENKGEYTSIPTRFLNNALKNEDIVIYGNGKQSRDFVYIKDLVDWLISFAKEPNAGIFDFGTGITTTYNDLAKMIIEMTNSESKIKYVSNPLVNYQEYTKATKPYMKAKFTLREALEDMLKEREGELIE